MKTINILTLDAPISRIGGGRPTRYHTDERLNAISPGKILCLGRVWAGELKPFVDSTITAVESLLAAPGLTPGHVLSAEPAPVVKGMIGRAWLGDLASRIKANSAATDSTTPTPEDCDVTEVLREVEQVRETLGTRAQNFGAVQDAIRRLRRSVDAVRSKPTGDAHPGIARNYRYGDFSKPVSGEDLNRNAKTFWASDRAPRPQESPPNRVARPMAPVTNAKGEAINKAHADLWATRK